MSGVPNLGGFCLKILGGADAIIIEIKCTINIRHLNHPETMPLLPSVEKLTSVKRLGTTDIENNFRILIAIEHKQIILVKFATV